jgi:RHH-type rel operon transcriptional repressor/antitoxin RelB
MADRSATVHIRPDLAAGLEELARATGRSASELVEEALAEYLDYQHWAGEHIREGLRQAEAGELIPDEEVWARLDERLAKRLGERAG